jgi:hypothetical protein
MEVRERFVHQVDGRLAHDGARERDALLLAARELRRAPRQQVVEADAVRRRTDAPVDVARGDAPRPQREGDVVEDGEVGIERVVLKHHRHVAAGGRDVVDLAIADPNGAGVDRLESGEQPQQRGLAAAGGAEQHQAFAVGDVEIDRSQRVMGAEALRHALEFHAHFGCYTPTP